MRPYTTRKDKTSPLLSLVENNKGWKRNNGDVYESLKDLARDLPEITENATFKRSDISVPSPWASMISFDIILKSNNNDFGALKTCAVNEWRVLLTLIALRDIYKIKLEKYEINISDENDNMADNAFFSNIYSLRPKKTLFSDESWSKFIFLTLEGNEIGAFSNSTLICSNYDYEPSNATKELIKLGFMDKELKFINPVNILKSDLAMSLYMSLWLEKVKEMIPNKNESADLEGVIDRFIDDLKKSFCGDIVIYNELANNNFFEFGFDFSNDYPTNSAELLWNVRIKKMDLTIPQIQSKIKLGKIGKPVFALETLGANVTRLINALEGNCIKPEGTFLDNNNVFLDKMSLVKFDDKPAFANIFGSCTISEPNGNSGVDTVKYSYILPLRNDDDIDIVNILSSDAVRKITRITETEEEIIVKMEFELEDGQPCILSKTYLKRECRKLKNDDLPMIAIWPYAVIKASKDSRENTWKDYYIFSAINELNKGNL